MKIAVLNECFLSDNHITYLKSIGDVEIFNDTTDETTAITRMAGKDIVLGDMFECPLNEKVLSNCPSVKLLCINSTGYDLVHLPTAIQNKTQVTNVPGFSTEAVAEHSFGLLLAVNRHIVSSNLGSDQIRSDQIRSAQLKPFQINPADKSHYQYLGSNLCCKTMGIIGLGTIGSHTAKIANGFGMKIIAYNRSPKNVENVEMVSLDELFSRSDVVSLHTPFNDQSKAIINTESLQKMKPNCILINTARGGCVVSKDLADALKNKKIAGAGLDVLDSWDANNPLLNLPNVVITPHSAWFTEEALKNIADTMISNVQSFVNGDTINVVSG